jgi:glutathione S-transferase
MVDQSSFPSILFPKNRRGRVDACSGPKRTEDHLMSQLASPVEIYWISGSPFAWRVLLTAEVKGIPYEGKLLEASKGELKTSEFLAINPLGRVPALRDGNFTLHESLAIMVYLDRKHPNPPLFGRTAEEAGRIFERISEFISDFWSPGQRLIRSIFFGPPLAADEAKEVREKIHLSLARLEECAESGDMDGGPRSHSRRHRRLSKLEAFAAGLAAPRSSSLGAGL